MTSHLASTSKAAVAAASAMVFSAWLFLAPGVGAGESEGAGDRHARQHQYARSPSVSDGRNRSERDQPPLSASGDRGADMKLKPAVAKSGKRSTTHVAVRARARHHLPNGEKLDASAVKWNIERVLDPKTAARIKAWFDPIKEVKVLSPTRLEIVTKTLSRAARPAVDVLPAAAEMGKREQPVACRARHRALRSEAVRQRRPDRPRGEKELSGAEKPTFERVTIRPIPEEASRVAAVMAGEVDIASGILPTRSRASTRAARRRRVAAGTRKCSSSSTR